MERTYERQVPQWSKPLPLYNHAHFITTPTCPTPFRMKRFLLIFITCQLFVRSFRKLSDRNRLKVREGGRRSLRHSGRMILNLQLTLNTRWVWFISGCGLMGFLDSSKRSRELMPRPDWRVERNGSNRYGNGVIGMEF